MLNQVHHHNMANIGNDVFKPNLKGFMVGNGVTNWKYDTDPAAFEMSYWHSLTDRADYDAFYDNNCDFSYRGPEPTGVCKEISDRFQNLFYNNVNIYDIFGHCWIPSAEHPYLYGASEMGLRVVRGQIQPYKRAYTFKDYTPWAMNFNKDKLFHGG